MDRKRARDVTLAVLATVAVALAATAAAPVFSQEQGTEESGDPQDPIVSEDPAEGDVIEFPSEAIIVAIIVIGAVGVLLQFARDPWETFKQSVKLVAIGAVFVAVLSYLYRTIELDFSVPEEEGTVEVGNVSLTPAPTPSGGGFGDGSTDPLVFPTENLLAAVLVAALFALVAVFAWRSKTVRSLLRLGTDTAETDPDPGLDEVARVASEAADRVDDAATATAADDAVYGAWRDMVGLLGIDDPQASTARQFARAAVDAGMDPDDVSILTRAFEEVRYGDAALSEDRRQEVTDAFRRIEAAHGADADGSGEGPR